MTGIYRETGNESLIALGIFFAVFVIPLILIIISIIRFNKEPKNKQTTQKDTKLSYYIPQYNQSLPYQIKRNFMTNREKVMYKILKEYCKENNFELMSKVRIADFIEPIFINGGSDFYHWFNKISAKHVDFLICDPYTLKPKAAIELDDSSHYIEKRKERDDFVNSVYKSAKLTIVHFWTLNETEIGEVLNKVFKIVKTKETTVGGN